MHSAKCSARTVKILVKETENESENRCPGPKSAPTGVSFSMFFKRSPCEERPHIIQCHSKLRFTTSQHAVSTLSLGRSARRRAWP